MSSCIGVGDTVRLVCPIPCEELEPLSDGVIEYCYPGDQAFLVRFCGGRIVVVAKTEFTEH